MRSSKPDGKNLQLLNTSELKGSEVVCLSCLKYRSEKHRLPKIKEREQKGHINDKSEKIIRVQLMVVLFII